MVKQDLLLGNGVDGVSNWKDSFDGVVRKVEEMMSFLGVFEKSEVGLFMEENEGVET